MVKLWLIILLFLEIVGQLFNEVGGKIKVASGELIKDFALRWIEREFVLYCVEGEGAAYEW